MAKLTLNDLANLQNESTAVSTINNNNQAVATAMENTLSRDGTSPNSMGANLDMNSNRILNLPLPSGDAEPVRKGEFDDLVEATTGVVDAAAALLIETQDARDAALVAQGAAEDAQIAAETAETNAETAETNAETAQGLAEGAQIAAEAAQGLAEAAQIAAETAQGFAENAQTAAETAQGFAEGAQTGAETAQGFAEGAQTAAETAQGFAEAARDAAQGYASDAEDEFEAFTDIYLGSYSTAPTETPNNTPLAEGMLYWNSASNNLNAYDGASWQTYSAATGITSVAEDTTPQLGGDLDLNSQDITGTGDITITGTITATTINQGANNVLDDNDIGVTVQGYDANILVSGDIGTTVQGYDADLASWAGVTRASGFDTFASTPSSANLASLVTDETGSGALVFATSPTLVTPDLGTPSAGTLTNCTGLPVASVVPDTSTALGVGSIELGHASDTTVSRVSAGVVAIEGQPLNGVVALSDGATPALDASLGTTFTLSAAGNRTIAVPTNPTAGQRIVIAHTASGANRTLDLDTGTGGFRFGADITELTATDSGLTDYIGCVYNAVSNKWDVVAYAKGY